MYSFGSIVLTRFPFTDLSASKVRPALVISRDNLRRSDLVLAFITSNVASMPADAISIRPTRQNGLKVPSLVRFDKIATLEVQIVAGKIGDAERIFLSPLRKFSLGYLASLDPKPTAPRLRYRSRACAWRPLR